MTLTNTFQALTITPEKRALIAILLSLLCVFTILFGVVTFVFSLIVRATPRPPPPRRRRTAINRQGTHGMRIIEAGGGSDNTAGPPMHLDAAQGEYEYAGSNDRGENTSSAFAFDFIGAFTILGASLFDALITGATSAVGYFFTSLPLLLILAGGAALTFPIAFNTKAITTGWNTVEVGYIRPILDYVIMPVVGLLVILFQAAYATWLTVNRLMGFLITGPGKTLLECAFPVLPQLLFGIGDLSATVAYAVAFWFSNNPLHTGIPLQDVVQVLTNMISLVWTTGVSCTCNVLNYIVGGIFKCINDASFALMVDHFVNAAYALPVETIVLPLVEQTRPSVNTTFDLTVQGLDSLSTWLETVTTCQFDIWLYGGNGTLINMVNGTLPMPTDDLKYLVRFLQSDWAHFLLFGAFALPTLVIFQPLYIIFLADVVFTPAGQFVWNFDWTRNVLIVSLDALGTIINIAPECNNAPTFVNIGFGQLNSIGLAIVWLAQVVIDVVVGEIYTTFNTPSRPFFYFLALYLFGNPHLQEFQWQISRLAESLGCTIAYLDDSVGVAFDGLAETVFIWLPLIPTQFIAFVRYLIETGDVNVLDSISLQPFQDALTQVSKLGEFWFQFQPGATQASCFMNITFFCSLGIFTQRLLSTGFQLLTLVLRMLIWLMKVVISSIQTNSLNNTASSIPDFQPMVDTAYSAGCRLGMIFGLIIPLEIPCMGSRPGFCKVKEFPNQAENTFSVCFATTLCKVGNILVVPLDLLAIALRYITTLNLIGSPLVTAIRQVVDIVVFRILSPICPLAHFFDCLFDILFQTGDSQEATPATSFFCLITGALVYLVQTFGDIILGWVDFFITVIIGVLNGISGDVGNWLLEVIQKFFTLLGASIEAVLTAIINFVLSVFMALVVALCWVVNVIIIFTISEKCTELEDAIAAVFGGSSSGFFSPEYVNYKRDLTGDLMMDEHGNPIIDTAPRKCALTSAQSFVNRFFVNLQRDLPSLFDPEAMGHDLDDKDPSTHEWYSGRMAKRDQTHPWTREHYVTSPHEECHVNHTTMANAKKRERANRFTGVIYRIMQEHFGPGLPYEQADDIPTYLATRVYWEPSSSCASLMRYANGTKMSKLGPADKMQMAECVRLKALAVTTRAFSMLSWVPEDIFYNSMERLLILGVQFMRFMIVALNWMVDQVVPVPTILSLQYRSHWEAMHVNVEHYDWITRAAQPDVEGKLPQTHMRVSALLSNLTLDSYLKRNFPDLYNPNATNSVERDPILGPLLKATRFAGDFAAFMMDGLYNQTTRDANNAANVSAHYYGHNMSNRTELLMEFGPDVMRSADIKLQTIGLYGTLAALISTIVSMARGTSKQGGHLPMDKFRDMLIEFGESMPVLAKRSIEAPFAAYDRWQDIQAISKPRMHDRVAQFYNSPAFKASPSVISGLVAAMGDLYARGVDIHPPGVIAPWCALKAARAWNVSVNDARSRLTPNMCNNLSVWDTVGNSTQNAFNWVQHMLRPRNAQAENGRAALWKIGTEVSDAVWRVAYVVYGGEKTDRAFGERVMDMSTMVVRSQNYYDPKRIAAIQRQQRIMTPRERNAEFAKWRRETLPAAMQRHREMLTRIEASLKAGEAADRREDAIHATRLLAQAKRELREQGLYVGDPKGMHMAALERVEELAISPVINSSFLFDKTCSNVTAVLCEECYFLARLVDLAIERVNYLVLYYTGYFVDIVGDLAASITYSLNQFAPVRIGRDGTSPPRFPALHEPAGIFFQFTDAEIANGGPSLVLWIENMIGGTIPSLWDGGPLLQKLNAYLLARNAAAAAGQPFQRQPSMELLSFIQRDLGWNICGVWDTVVFIATDRIDEIGAYLFDHLLVCRYLSEIDCSNQVYSWSGGALVTLVWFGGLALATFILFMPFPMVYGPVFMGLAIGAIFFHTIITYNWSAWCAVVPPQCEVVDVYKFVTLTALPKCNALVGGLVLNNTYNNYNCYQANLTWDFAECTEEGFNTIFDNLAYFKLWLGGDLGISEWLAPIYGSIWGSTTPSTDFSGWDTDPVRYSVFGICSVVTVVPYGLTGALMSLLAVIVVLSALRIAPLLVLAGIVFFINLARFSIFAANDIMKTLEDDEEDDDEDDEDFDYEDLDDMDDDERAASIYDDDNI